MSYWVINLARDIRGRTRRWSIPGPARRVLLLCDGAVRVVRGRPVEISEALFQKYASQLKALQENGSIEVRHTNTHGPVCSFGSVEVPLATLKTEEPAKSEEPAKPDDDDEDDDDEAVDSEPEPDSPDSEAKEGDQTKSLDKMGKAELVEWLATHTDTPAEQWSNYTRKKLIKEAKGLEK